jgi:hypothetical protein
MVQDFLLPLFSDSQLGSDFITVLRGLKIYILLEQEPILGQVYRVCFARQK